MRAFAIGLAFLLAACSGTPTPKFVTDSAPGFNAASYRTYSWAFGDSPKGSNALLKERVMKALDQSFAARGYQHVASGGDMILAFTLGARDRVETTDWGPVGPYYPGYGRGYGYGWAYPYRDVDVRSVTEGSLAMDVFDGRTEHPVWHGIASGRITSDTISDAQIMSAAEGLAQRFVATTRPAG